MNIISHMHAQRCAIDCAHSLVFRWTRGVSTVACPSPILDICLFVVRNCRNQRSSRETVRSALKSWLSRSNRESWEVWWQVMHFGAWQLRHSNLVLISCMTASSPAPYFSRTQRDGRAKNTWKYGASIQARLSDYSRTSKLFKIDTELTEILVQNKSM